MLRYNGVKNQRSFKQTVPFTKKATSMLHAARYNLKETSSNQEKTNSDWVLFTKPILCIISAAILLASATPDYSN